MRQFAVVGLGRFGSSVAKELSANGCQVIAIDIDEDRVQEFSEIVTQGVCVDATSSKTLRAVGIGDVDVAVVSVGDDIEASILITLALKEAGVKQVIAKAVTEDQGKILERIGADKIVFPERDMGIKLANSLISVNVHDYIELSSECSIVEIKPPKDFVGKSLKKLNLRTSHGLNIIAIKSLGEDGKTTVTSIPEADYEIREQDTLIIVGPNSNIDKLKNKE